MVLLVIFFLILIYKEKKIKSLFKKLIYTLRKMVLIKLISQPKSCKYLRRFNKDTELLLLVNFYLFINNKVKLAMEKVSLLIL
jgi:hypothetical protein